MTAIAELQLPDLHTRAAVVPDTWDAETRTVEVMWSSGAEADQYSWTVGRFLETLEVTPEACDLTRLNSGANVLADHSTWSVHRVLGVIERAWIKDGKGYARVRFSDREEVAGIVRDIENGILRSFSVGYRVRKYRDDSKPDEDVKRFTAIEWEPYELSVVSVPAEPGAGTRSAGQGTTHRAIVQSGDEPMRNFGRGVGDSTSEQINGGGNAGAGAPAPAPANQRTADSAPAATATAPAPAQAPPAGDANRTAAPNQSIDTAADAARAVEAERARSREIREHCRALRLPQEATDRLIDTGRSLSELAADVAREFQAVQPESPGEIRTAIAVGTEELEKHREAATAALFARMRPGSEAARNGVEHAGEFRARSVSDIVRIFEQVRGRDGLRMGRDDIARRAFHQTGDLPILLEEAGRRTLLDAYQLRVASWRAWCREGDLMDFREHDRVRVGDTPELELVPAGGDVKFGTIGESKETIKLASYAKGIGFDRRALINDDLGALSRIIESQAQRVSDLVSNLVYTELENGKVGGTGLFVAGKNNSAAVALDVAGIGTLEQKMLEQKSEGGMPLALMPKYLLVPTALKLAADKLTAEINPTQASEVNPYRGVLTPVVEPRLSNAAHWYIVADPAQIDTIEVAWLEGARGPQFASQEVFENRGMKFAVWADVAAKVIDYRGLAKSTGA